MSHLPALGNLFEGHLRQEGDGPYKIEQEDGTFVYLEDVLEQYLDKEIRCTIVGLKELDTIADMLRNQ